MPNSYIKNPSPIRLEFFETIPSTSQYLKETLPCITANKTPCEPRACLSESQSHGRGTHQRQWYSPPGQNIYLSLDLPMPTHFNPTGLSLVVGISVIEAVNACLPGLELRIKWPNDVVWHDQKLAGILTEIENHHPNHMHVIIGVGLNVNMDQLPSTDDVPSEWSWTSLQQITQSPHDRQPLTAALINTISEYATQFSQTGLRGFLETWKSYDALYGRAIQFDTPSRRCILGTALGIDRNGRLLIRESGGTISAHVCGGRIRLPMP